MTIESDFAARFPNFDTAISSVWLPIVIGTYKNYYCVDYNADSQEAILNLLAHLMLVESQLGDGPSMVKSSQSVGSVSVTFDLSEVNRGQAATFYNTTRYGQAFWHLINLSAGGGVWV